MRQRKCKVCGEKYTPTMPLQTACSLLCAIEHGKVLASKKEAKDTREKRKKLKSRAQWAREAQHVFNKYIRVRDAHLPCVSCGRPHTWDGQWHASHFRSVGASSALRFNLWNVHKSCSICNNWKSGNIIEYEPRLREKIGSERVDWLRNQSGTREYDIEYLKRIIKIFKEKTKRMEKNRCSM